MRSFQCGMMSDRKTKPSSWEVIKASSGRQNNSFLTVISCLNPWYDQISLQLFNDQEMEGGEEGVMEPWSASFLSSLSSFCSLLKHTHTHAHWNAHTLVHSHKWHIAKQFLYFGTFVMQSVLVWLPTQWEEDGECSVDILLWITVLTPSDMIPARLSPFSSLVTEMSYSSSI